MLMMDCKCNTGGFRGRIPPPPFFSLTVLEIFNEKKTVKTSFGAQMPFPGPIDVATVHTLLQNYYKKLISFFFSLERTKLF